MATLVKKEPYRLASIATVRDEDPASAGLHHLLNVLGLLGQAPEEKRSNHSFSFFIFLNNIDTWKWIFDK